MKLFSSILLTTSIAALASSSPAHAEDILSILERNADNPPVSAPTTIPYSYTLSLDVTERDGKDLEAGKAVFRIDPSKPAGSRAQILSSENLEIESLQEFLKDMEDPENDMAKQADGFWCNGGDSDSDADFDPSDFVVLSETDTEAILKPKAGTLAKLLMQSDDNAEKNGKKMMKKLLKRIDGEITLSKPDASMKAFSVTMTRPIKMMLVAKLKVMDMDMTCALAPNGHYHTSTMNMRVEGKAMGSRFGQTVDMQISELTPLPYQSVQ